MIMKDVPPTALNCHICFKLISSKANMTKHMLIHNNQKNHECEVCLKRFRMKHHLRRHMFAIHKMKMN